MCALVIHTVRFVGFREGFARVQKLVLENVDWQNCDPL